MILGCLLVEVDVLIDTGSNQPVRAAIECYVYGPTNDLCLLIVVDEKAKEPFL